MIAGKEYQASKVDIWSCGVILYAMLTGYLPFEDKNTSKLYKKILRGHYDSPKFLSKEAEHIITGLLTTDPSKRYDFAAIKSHRWFQTYQRKTSITQGIIIGFNRIPVTVTA